MRAKGQWNVSDKLTANAMLIRSRNDAGGTNISNFMDSKGDVFFRQVVRNGLPLRSSEKFFKTDIQNITLNYDLGFADMVTSSSWVDLKSGSGIKSK